MNERQPYEKLIADKLQQLPAPDADASWQKMKRLLDDNDRRAGGGKNGNGGWWRAGLIAILLIAGFWFYTENSKPSGKELSSVTRKNSDAAKNNSKAAVNTNNNNKTTTTDNTTTSAKSTTGSSQQHTGNNKPAGNANTNGNTKSDPAPGSGIIFSSPADKSAGIDKQNNLPGNKSATSAGSIKPGNPNNNVKNAVTPEYNKINAATNRPVTNIPAAGNNVAADKNNTSYKKIIDKKPHSNSKPFTQPGTETDNSLLVKNSTGRDLINKNNTTGKSPYHLKTGSNIKNSPGTNTDFAVNKRVYVVGKKDKAKTGGRYRTGNNNKKTGDDDNGNVLNQTSFALNNTKDASLAGKNNIKQQENNNVVTGKANSPGETWLAKQQLYYERLSELKIGIEYNNTINTPLAIGDSMESNRNTSNLLSSEAKALAAKAQKAQAEEALAKKAKKSFKLNLGNVFKPFSLHVDAEPWWAAGLALNNSVAVNAQSRYNYNVNAKSGVLSDYIPSPYVQFHLNDYVYMQTELNLSTPQLTPQLLLYQKAGELAGTPGVSQQKSIYVQKLYYFNWPFSLHYSPVNNLYIAAGLQFSSFQSGLALIQNKRYQTQVGNPNDPMSTDNSIEKFKDDSIAAKLSPTEWRWQTGVDYYWNRVTIGMRYNKAFKDLVNINVSSALPLTNSRNSAFLFFMRYNLFEGRKKDNAGPRRSLVRY